MSLNTIDRIDPKDARRSLPLNASKSSAITHRKPSDKELGLSIIVSIGIHCLIVMFVIWGWRQLQNSPEQDGAKEEGTKELRVNFMSPDEQPPLTVPDIAVPVFAPTVTNTQPDPPILKDPLTIFSNPEIVTSVSVAPETKTTLTEQQPDKGKDKGEERRRQGTAGKGQSDAGGEDGSRSNSGSGPRGGQRVGTERWYTPKPDYPADQKARRIQGSGRILVSTGASGSISRVVFMQRINPVLDANTRSFVLNNWTGPPNKARDFPVVYQLHD